MRVRERISVSALYWASEGHMKVKTGVQNGRKSLIFRLSGCKWLGGRWSLCQRRKMAGGEKRRWFAPRRPRAGGREQRWPSPLGRIQRDRLMFSLYLQETWKMINIRIVRDSGEVMLLKWNTPSNLLWVIKRSSCDTATLVYSFKDKCNLQNKPNDKQYKSLMFTKSFEIYLGNWSCLTIRIINVTKAFWSLNEIFNRLTNDVLYSLFNGVS